MRNTYMLSEHLEAHQGFSCFGEFNGQYCISKEVIRDLWCPLSHSTSRRNQCETRTFFFIDFLLMNFHTFMALMYLSFQPNWKHVEKLM